MFQIGYLDLKQIFELGLDFCVNRFMAVFYNSLNLLIYYFCKRNIINFHVLGLERT